MIRYAVLTSGSCGNCYAFFDGERTVLVDDGLTLSGLKRRLADAGIPYESVSDVFLTHSHPDHSKGLGVLYRNRGVVIHASRLCQASDRKVFARLGLGDDDISVFDFGDEMVTGSFRVTGFRTSHDSAGSAGYLISCGGTCFFLMTDTGLWSEESLELARKGKVIFLESNYDEGMLESGHYPDFLKARIRGGRGHLSNDQARDFLSRLGDGERRIFLIHLSENNNSPETVEGLYRDSGLSVVVCERGRTYGGYSVEEE